MVIDNLLAKGTQDELAQEMLCFPNDRVPQYAEKVYHFSEEYFKGLKRRADAFRENKRKADLKMADQEKRRKEVAVKNFPTLGGHAMMEKENRRICLCQGMRHGAMGNCLNCGKINCAEEGIGACLFCGTDLGYVGNPSAALEKAMAMKDKLVDFDKNAAKRTKVYDDSADWFSETTNPWLSQSQRKKADDEGKRLEEEKRLERRKVHLTFDLFGRAIVEMPPPSAARKVQEREDFEDWMEATTKGEGGGNLGGIGEETMHGMGELHGAGVSPTLMGDSKKLYDGLRQMLASKKQPAPTASSTAPPPGQDALGKPVSNEFDEASFNFHAVKNSGFRPLFSDVEDLGRVLSLHQPWASLVIAGFKRGEGRKWHSDYRGRLWIHAAAKEPDTEEIAALEQHYTYVFTRAGIKFPKFPSETNGYPTSCLLGCVDFTDVFTNEEWCNVLKDNPSMPQEQSSSEYIFFVRNPRRLVVPIPLSGDHKIWTLDKKKLPSYHQGLVPVVWEDSIEGPKSLNVHLDLWPKAAGSAQKLKKVASSSLSEPKTLILLDGLVHMENFINLEIQQKLIDAMRETGLNSNGWYIDHFDNGAKASGTKYPAQQILEVHRLSLGRHWDATSGKWLDVRRDGTQNPPITPELQELYTLAVSQGNKAMNPKKHRMYPSDGKCEIAIINFYTHQAKLGTHRDSTESKESIRRGDPVIGICIGDDCDFSFSMDPPSDEQKPKIVRLKSGDAIAFGGNARLMWHGVHRIIAHTAPPELNLIPGRMSLTLRCK